MAVGTTDTGVFLNVDLAEERLKILEGALGKQLMGEIGMLLMTRIKTRTLAGKDVDNSPFAPYSAKYAFFRAKKGRPIDKVDLFFTGSMQSAMTYMETDSWVRVSFLPTQDRTGTSNPGKAFWLNKKRKFFAMSNEDRREIWKLISDAISKGMGG